MHMAEFWKETLSQIQQTTSESEFVLFFSNLNVTFDENNNLTVETPSAFFRDKLKSSFGSKIEEILKDLTGHQVNIEFTVKTTPEKGTSKSNEKPSEKVVEKAPVKVLSNEADKVRHHINLNPDFTFDNFVVGVNNDFAYNCAIAISNNPGTNYNPLLLYGGVGLGKTHLMQAIGNAIHQNNPKANIVYKPSETFVVEFLEALKTNKTSAFKNKYRNADILLLDDIHDFKGKRETQEELFNTFNALYQSKKQMVFTCDRPPQELKDFADRLLTRLTQGINADLQFPTWETRMVILKKKLENRNVTVSDEILELISRKITTNIRDLEQGLKNIIAYTELTNRELTVEVTQSLLKNTFSGPLQQGIPMDLVMKVVAEFYKMSVSDLKGKKRTQAITQPRQIAMYVIREMTEFSTTEVGIEFGGRDHTTVMHAVQKIIDKLKTEPNFDIVIQNIMRTVRERANAS